MSVSVLGVILDIAPAVPLFFAGRGLWAMRKARRTVRAQRALESSRVVVNDFYDASLPHVANAGEWAVFCANHPEYDLPSDPDFYHFVYWRTGEVRQARAWGLLWRYLSPTQRREMKWINCFAQVGSDNKIYVIRTDSLAYNVTCFDDGMEFCGYPYPTIPMGDIYLGQKDLIAADAAKFRKIAFRRRIR